MSTIAPTQTVTLSIDGKQVTTDRGKTVLEAALDNGIYIPNLCFFAGTTPFAGCRLCLVEIEGSSHPETSCTVPAKEGMVVRTDTPAVRQLQRQVLQLLLTEHPDRCLNCVRLERCPPFLVCQRDLVVTDRCLLCPQNRNCELQRVVDFLGRPQQWVIGPRVSREPERSNPYMERNQDYCIYCTRCVRICDEQRGIAAYGVAQPSADPHIVVPFDIDLKDTNCIFCGACAIGCPTGAIMKNDSRYASPPDARVNTVCSYCGVGCSLVLDIEDGRIARVTPRGTEPTSTSSMCVRGHFWYGYVHDARRLTAPLVRDSGDRLSPVSWELALDNLSSRLAAIRGQYGPDSIGFVSTGKTTNEEAYLLQKLARAVVGTNNVDLAELGDRYSAVAGVVQERLGYAASTASLDDLEESGCVLVLDADPAVSHPVLAQRLWQAVRRGTKVVLVTANENNVAQYAHLVLRPKAGTMAALLNGILRLVLDGGMVDSGHVTQQTEGLEALAASLSRYTPEALNQETGVAAEDIQRAAELFVSGGWQGGNGREPFWYGTEAVEPWAVPDTTASCIILGGEDAETADAALNLALLTGNVGRQGGGILLMPPENNTQGSADMGVRPGWLPGYLPVGDAEATSRIEAAWGVRPPTAAGMGYAGMLEAARQGKLKALFVLAGTPPAIDVGDFRPASASLREVLALGAAPQGTDGLMEPSDASRSLDLLVVEDITVNPTTELAHVLLPGAAYAEKEGTYTNLERRVQHLQPALDPVGQALPDWAILCTLARKLQAALGAEPKGFDFASPEEVMAEIARVAPAYSGMSYDSIGDDGIIWPVEEGASASKVRLKPAG